MNPPPTPADSDFPQAGRLLGIDYGARRVGIAISTGDQRIASPVAIMQRVNPAVDSRYFRKLLEEHVPVGIVLGLPLHAGGEEGSSANAARKFGDWLREVTQLPLTYWDERYTSAVAEDFMISVDMTRKQRKKRVDMLAAQIILQSYLERPRHDAPVADSPPPLESMTDDQENIS